MEFFSGQMTLRAEDGGSQLGACLASLSVPIHMRRLNAAILPKMDHSRGSITTAKPSSSDLENALSTNTEPCPTDRPIDPRTCIDWLFGEKSGSPC